MNARNQNTKAQISLIEAILIFVGIVIGSGIFFKPTRVLLDVGGAPGLALLAWVIGASLTMFAALSIAELAANITKQGGLITYIRDLYGEKWGFMLGWVQVLIYYPGLTAALAVVFSTQCTTLIDLNPIEQKLVSVGLILTLMVINLISANFAAKFTVLFTILKLIPIAAIIFAGVIMGKAHSYTPLVTADSTPGGFGAALLGVLFAYGGWLNLTYFTKDLRRPERDMSRAIVVGIAAVTVIYIAVNLAIFNTMTPQEIMDSQRVGVDASIILFGQMGASVIAVGILISIVGCLSGFIMTAAKVPNAMALTGVFPFQKKFALLSERGVPKNALFLEVGLAIVYAISGEFDILTNMAEFAIWAFYILGIAGVFLLRKKHHHLLKDGQYRVPLYPLIPILGIAGSAYVCVSTLLSGALYAIVGVLITVAGLPVFLFLRKKKG